MGRLCCEAGSPQRAVSCGRNPPRSSENPGGGCPPPTPFLFSAICPVDLRGGGCVSSRSIRIWSSLDLPPSSSRACDFRDWLPSATASSPLRVPGRQLALLSVRVLVTRSSMHAGKRLYTCWWASNEAMAPAVETGLRGLAPGVCTAAQRLCVIRRPGRLGRLREVLCAPPGWAAWSCRASSSRIL